MQIYVNYQLKTAKATRFPCFIFFSQKVQTFATTPHLYPRDYVDADLEALILDETYVDHPTPDYALHRQSQAIAGFDSYDQLPHLRMPVLVMTGEDDVLVPPGNSETLAERIPGAELVKIPGAGHGFLKQRTYEAVPKILGFLKRVDEG